MERTRGVYKVDYEANDDHRECEEVQPQRRVVLQTIRQFNH